MSEEKADQNVEKSSNPTRRDWENNHELIQAAYFKLLEKNKKIPSIRQLMEETSLSDSTIERHLKDLGIDKIKHRFLPMIEQVIKRIGERAIATGKAPEAKLFLQVIADYREKNETAHTFESDEAKKKIEEIFLK